MKKLKRHTVEENLEFVLNENTPEEIKKQYRKAAKNLIKLMENRKSKSVVITSPNIGEGKSLSCVREGGAQGATKGLYMKKQRLSLASARQRPLHLA